MNQIKISKKIKDLFLYFLSFTNDLYNQHYSTMNIYIIKLSNKIMEKFSISEIETNIDFLQKKLLYYLQNNDFYFDDRHEYVVYMIALFLESFYFAETKLVHLDYEYYLIYVFETEDYKRNLKKVLN
ncbi:hypothetical protein [Candidatus Phytoplasma melaleucae]|uniref:Uncharacterized protein n=1 Tax=Candidatus Phytoplasma melaleucae TaxID=2982630 RepID=A0ABT9DDP3_9MOLU|nr:hypothetical protein ['Melaleuca sp.' phytoplasma]MDO8168149.1 hypothetical protein ['Melaleuca sp.' phytoplasma]MDV3205223.1 hypothetical protein [Weeping tea tree witches'-broom phytoplasma]